MAQSRLEEIALAQRDILIARNTFNNTGDASTYNATHTNAVSDDQTPTKGKGTGVFLDVFNGGSSSDIFGVASAAGSGRISNIASNQFNETNPYTAPDTTLNTGQVTLT